MRRTLLPDLILDAHGAQAGVGITIEDGCIVGIGPSEDGERLPGRAFCLGFVNDHSHAFQRGLRGTVERIDPSHPHDDFWTWREKMYELAGDLTPESMRLTSERCFGEMLSAGYTSVTEFHYVHHQADGTPYENPNALAKAVAEAAEAVGIRLLLLPTAYNRGGHLRFVDSELPEFLERVDALRGWASERPMVEVGVAAHSVRAVPRVWLEGLRAYANTEGLKLHIHADEQPREIEECKREHGLRPVELLAECGFLGPQTTIVHATHANERELDLLSERGSSVCACPTTEGNLGDGFLPAKGILNRDIPLTIGSDSHVRVDPLEELREIETNARRLSDRRNVLISGDDVSPTPYLLRTGWGVEGMKSGDPADFIELDLTHPSLVDVQPSALPSALVFGASSAVVAGTWVGGRRVYREDRG